MEFWILGPLEVSEGGRPIEVPRRKQRALLAALLLHAGEAVSAERLVQQLWGEDAPPRALGSLQNTVSQVRRLLGPDVLVTRPPGYALAIPREAVDLGVFERLTAEAAGAPVVERAEKLREALALWRGAPLADLAFEPFAPVEIARLGELRIGAQEELVDAELALGRHRDLVADIEALIVEHPLRERLRCQLILALYRSGRQAEALEAYRAAREMLVDELGIEPSPELQRLEQAVLRQDPALEFQAAAPPPEPAPMQEARRKTVTVLFADIVDSTALATGLDPEVLQAVMASYFDVARTAIERHEGVVEKFIGDAVAAVFGIPDLHEDDALRAVRAAQDLRTAIATLNGELDREHGVTLAVGVGVSTGEVIAGDLAATGALAIGPAMTVAARLEQATFAGEILIGPETLELVGGAVSAEPVEPVDVGGRVGRVQAFRLLSVDADATVPTRALAAPLIGRKTELEQLKAAFAAVHAERHSRVVTVLGEAGIGKTRLSAEFLDSLADGALTLVGRCAPYGEGATYLPLASALRKVLPGRAEGVAAMLAGDDQAELVARRIAEVMGRGDGGAPPGEIFWAVRRLLEALARERPLVLVLEDVQWAEPTLLDLVEDLRERGADAPLLVLCLARSDLLERRREWGDRDSVKLAPLPEVDARALVGNLADLSEADRARIVETAGGNALFLEQLAAYADEQDGVLQRVPRSIEALLGSRLERLGREERLVLEWAAVVGKEFSRAAVRHLAENAPDVDEALMALLRRGLIHAGRAAPGAEDAVRFHHALVREVAYGAIPKDSRARLHERLARWLDGRPAGTHELVGYHFEQAHRYRAEVRRGDPELPRLADEAGRRLGVAGIRAWKRADAPAAVNLLGRATALLPKNDPGRIEMLCELGLALKTAGDLGGAEVILGEAASAAEDRRLGLRARLELENIRLASDPKGRSDALLALAADAIPVLEELGDDRALGRALRLVGYVQGAIRCQNEAWLEAMERALVHYERSEWPRAWCVGGIAAALYHGPTPASEALRRCKALLADGASGRLSEADVTVHAGGLEAMLGRFDEARTLVDRAERMYADVGARRLSIESIGQIRGRIEMLAGDAAAAERVLRASYEAFAAMDDLAWLATEAAELAEALYAQGRYDESEVFAQKAAEHGAADDVPTQLALQGVRAKLLARRGAFAEAEALGLDAIAIAERTDALNQRAQVLLDVAEATRIAGRPGDAVPLVHEATGLFRRKENVVGIRRAEAMLATIARSRRSRGRNTKNPGSGSSVFIRRG